MRPMLATLLLLAAAGCAEGQWGRKDTADEQARTDLRECEETAYRDANAVPQPYPTMGPAILQDSSGRRFNVYPTGPFADPYGERYMREGRLARECMRKKGYELVAPK